MCIDSFSMSNQMKATKHHCLVILFVFVWFQKISISHPRMVFHFESLHPSGNSSLALYFPLKILAFETPHPLRISSDNPWGGGGVGYGYFLEPHILYKVVLTVIIILQIINSM